MVNIFSSLLEKPASIAQRHRRPSACSALDYLPSPTHGSSMLSPNSAENPSNLGGNTRRRNSYAATTEASDCQTLLTPLMSPEILMSYGSSHFLDPRTTQTSFKRRLPPTPNEAVKEPAVAPALKPLGYSSLTPRDFSPRRSSSPRVLPPTPTEDNDSSSSADNRFFDQQKRSITRRLLPPEPLNGHGPVLLKPTNSLTPDRAGCSVSLGGYNGAPLVRSSSTRSSRENSSRYSNANFLSSADFSHYKEGDRPTELSDIQRAASDSVYNRLHSEPLGRSTDELGHQQQLVPNELRSHNYLLNSCPPPITTSAPPSPREDLNAGEGLSIRANSMQSHQDFVVQQQRKYSSDAASSIANDVATMSNIASLSLVRNGSGSMAHLLEVCVIQQHILRREFTSSASPDSGCMHQSASNSSSPSMEHINYAVTTAAARHPISRSGSETEAPSNHGIDPALYAAGATPVPEVNGSAGHTLLATTSFGNATAGSGGADRPKGLGLIHCALQLFPARKRLRVSVLKIEGLAGELKPELDIQPFCKLSLMPGKKHQQQGVVKRGRDAVFNQEFFFDGLGLEDIKGKEVRVEVCHQSAQKLQKDLDIGEIRIPLKDLSAQLQTKKEVRVVEELRILPSSKKLGKLTITTCIEKEAKRLTINIIKVEDLPKWGIIGAPDVCIRIRLQQGSGNEVTKSSRVIKNSTSAVYKEAIMFLVNTREADMARTKITITVHDVSRTATGNDVIGFCFLGELAVDKSEIDQWKSTMDHWSKEYKAVHQLKSSQNPEVCISEAHSDEGGEED